jgi:hypothetical protein
MPRYVMLCHVMSHYACVVIEQSFYETLRNGPELREFFRVFRFIAHSIPLTFSADRSNFESNIVLCVF